MKRLAIVLALYFAHAGAILAEEPAPQESNSASERQRRREGLVQFAMREEGDPLRGREVFFAASKANCSKCHSTDGSRKGPGPDLATIGDKFERRELLRAILEPSFGIAIGFSTTNVFTDEGRVVSGVLQRVTGEEMELATQEGQTIRIPLDEIESASESETSTMPAGMEASMTNEEFADLVAYLETLRERPGPASSSWERDEIPRATRGAELSPYFDETIRFDHPVWIGVIPGDSDRFVVLEHFGRGWIVDKGDGSRRESLFDLTKVVRPGGATGLLGMAFHPAFPQNREYYLKYQIAERGQIATVVEERRFARDRAADSGDPPREILHIPGVTQDHNGGCLTFGPDGFLYIGAGDTGPQRDPEGHGQDLNSLQGKILRIDVDWPTRPYGIPRDNPFREVAGARPEIWASGFREPWRFSFDGETGDLWVGDVGQDRYEEVAIVRSGENHGWNVFEGFAPFSDQYRRAGEKYVPPIVSYPRRLGVSVTGGYVYRGGEAPALRGWYVFGDFESRRIWALRQEERELRDIVEIGRCSSRLVSFGEDAAGELLAVGYDSGLIYRLDLKGVDLTPMRSVALAATSESSPVLWRFTLDPPDATWASTTFNDENWTLAPGGFGAEGTPGSVVRTDWHTGDIWLRRQFDMPSGSIPDGEVALRIHHDEDAEISLNGVLIQTLGRWTNGYEDVALAPNVVQSLRPTGNVLAIHCHQNSGGQYIDAGLVEMVAGRK